MFMIIILDFSYWIHWAAQENGLIECKIEWRSMQTIRKTVRIISSASPLQKISITFHCVDAAIRWIALNLALTYIETSLVLALFIRSYSIEPTPFLSALSFNCEINHIPCQLNLWMTSYFSESTNNICNVCFAVCSHHAPNKLML